MRKVTGAPKVCEHCGSVLKPEKYDYFCDYCQEKFDGENRAGITVFWKGRNPSTVLDFCSLRCARKWLLEFPWNRKQVAFISLPYVDGLTIEKFLRDEKDA